MIMITGFAGAAYIGPIEKVESSPSSQQTLMQPNGGEIYEGGIKIFILEPHSYRWTMYDGQPFEYAFLDFAWDTAISINYMDTLSRSIIWNGASEGYGDIQENNIMAIAAVYNAESHTAFSDPPYDNMYIAHYFDACAAADYQNSWPNQTTENFTHTVFVEEATATW